MFAETYLRLLNFFFRRLFSFKIFFFEKIFLPDFFFENFFFKIIFFREDFLSRRSLFLLKRLLLKFENISFEVQKDTKTSSLIKTSERDRTPTKSVQVFSFAMISRLTKPYLFPQCFL